MNGMLALVAWLAVVNPPRTRIGLPERDGQARMEIAGPGVILGVLVLVVIAGLGEPLLDALEVSPEMFRIAAAFVLVIGAAWMVFVPVPPEEPVLSGLGGAVWPVAYPRVVTPEAIALAITTGASDGLEVGAIAAAGAVLLILGAVRLGPLGQRVFTWIGRLFALAVVVVAVWLAIQGIREV